MDFSMMCKLDSYKIKVMLARNCTTLQETAEKMGADGDTLRHAVYRGTATTRICGELAKVLGVDVTEIMLEE